MGNGGARSGSDGASSEYRTSVTEEAWCTPVEPETAPVERSAWLQTGFVGLTTFCYPAGGAPPLLVVSKKIEFDPNRW